MPWFSRGIPFRWREAEVKHSKIARHTSSTPAERRVIDALTKSDLVKKIVLGPGRGKVTRFRDGYMRVRHSVDAGLVLSSYSGKGCRDVYLYCRPGDRDAVAALVARIVGGVTRVSASAPKDSVEGGLPGPASRA